MEIRRVVKDSIGDNHDVVKNVKKKDRDGEYNDLIKSRRLTRSNNA